jgi:hypothetical protein
MIKNDSTQKYIIVAVMAVLFIVGFVGGKKFFGQQQQTVAPLTGTKPVNTNTNVAVKDQTNLLVIPASLSFKVGQSHRMSVFVSKGDIQAADVVLKYDPKVFMVSDIKAGKDFPMLLNQSIINGQVAVSVSIGPDNAKKLATGELFTFNVQALSPAATTLISFDPKNSTTAKDGENTLQVTTGGSYTVTQ